MSFFDVTHLKNSALLESSAVWFSLILLLNSVFVYWCMHLADAMITIIQHNTETLNLKIIIKSYK